MLKEFKEFAMKGNVIDMAVGIVIGTAFGKIVSSFVSDMIMPAVGVMTGGVDFGELSITLKKAVGETEAVTLNYGAFINTIIDFIIIAFAIFFAIKVINKMRKKEEEEEKTEKEEPKEESGPTEVELLTEIRDSLKK